jgi:glutamine synthetase
MDPLPGYEFANWETGYGDLNAAIDPQTVRTLPWLPGSVLVLCDLLTMDGEPVEGRQRSRTRAHSSAPVVWLPVPRCSLRR